jgi:hypothetical protein
MKYFFHLFPRLKRGSYEIKWGCLSVTSQRSKKHQWSIGCFRYPTLVQSCFEGLWVQPIGWFHYPDLVQSGFLGTVKSGNQMEGPYFIIVEKLLFSFRLLNRWLVEKGHQPEELFWNMKAASREWHPGGRRPRTSRCFRNFQ